MQPDMKISVVRRADAESPGSTKQKIDFRISSITCMDTVMMWLGGHKPCMLSRAAPASCQSVRVGQVV